MHFWVLMHETGWTGQGSGERPFSAALGILNLTCPLGPKEVALCSSAQWRNETQRFELGASAHNGEGDGKDVMAQGEKRAEVLNISKTATSPDEAKGPWEYILTRTRL